jgi:two-component system, LuxR family, response regulator FixJ
VLRTIKAPTLGQWAIERCGLFGECKVSDRPIIVVDDDPAVLSSIKWLLEMQGYNVRAYADAESLLDEPRLPDQGCLLLDYRLPAMDGLELLRQLRLRGVTLPAVLITTRLPATARAAAAAGVPLLEKPFTADAIAQAVSAALSAPPSRPSQPPPL